MASVVLTTIHADADVIFVPADHQTINAAIEASSNGDIIQIDPGIYFENLVVNNKRIAIRGGDIFGEIFGETIIDGSAAKGSARSCVLVTGTSELVLDQLVLRNGGGSSIFGITRGGGIYAEYSVLELIRVTVEACSVEAEPFGEPSWGGAICNYGGSIVLDRCVIRDNRSDGQGGGIWSTQGVIQMANRLVTGNSSSDGGGLYAEGGSISIDLSIFHDNLADKQGGAIMARSGVDLSIFDSRFDANRALDGAALWSSVPQGVIQYTTFERQVAETEVGGAALRLADLSLGGAEYLIGGSVFCGNVGLDISGAWLEGLPNVFDELCPLLGDLDRNGLVDGADLTLLLGEWGTPGVALGADLDFSGFVGGGDLTILLGAWNP